MTIYPIGTKNDDETRNIINNNFEFLSNGVERALSEAKNAYDLWLAEGNEGTLQEYFDSLKGKTAYEVAVDNGFEGSESEWVASLKNNLTPKEPVGTFNDLPSDAKKNEIRLVQDENKQYVFDGTNWVEFGAVNLDGLHVVEENLLNLRSDLAKASMQPKFIEFFGSFSRYGIGVPSGVSNYSGGNYVLDITGNAGDTFITITSGNISHAGGIWACVIQNDGGKFELNKVISNDGVSKLNLLEPLKSTIINGKLGNLQDSVNGQHYTELGYYAFAQHIYYANTRYVERNKVLSQFLPTDTVIGKWSTNALVTPNNTTGILDATNKTLNLIGSKHASFYYSDSNKYSEYNENVNGYKGYIETFLTAGLSGATAKLEYFEDDILKSSATITNVVDRYIFPFENVKKIKIRITPISGTPFSLRVGRTTVFINERYQDDRLINPSDKVVYIGDSWGEFHNKATTRELERLMKSDGGSPIIWNYSRGGHTSTYAREGFKKYVIDNKPDKVIIEYFTNDFNSIKGTVLQPFTATDGTQKDMNIKDLAEYQANIQYMIDESIKHGIQPIVIMPAATNSESQTLNFGNFTNELWNGKLTNVTEMYLKNLLVDNLISNGLTSKDSTKAGEGILELLSKEINSSSRKGVVSNSSVNLTAADIHGFYNNGVRKAGVNFEGVIDMSKAKFAINQYNIPATESNRGVLYIVNGTATNNVDEYYTVKKLADGSYKTSKILTQDV